MANAETTAFKCTLLFRRDRAYMGVHFLQSSVWAKGALTASASDCSGVATQNLPNAHSAQLWFVLGVSRTAHGVDWMVSEDLFLSPTQETVGNPASHRLLRDIIQCALVLQILYVDYNSITTS